ncbi:hypothetical protein Tco_1180468, partial [Tanacetum coccineum]
DLASLAFFQETEGPYHTDLPTPDDIRRFLQLERVESNRTIKELRQDMKRWEELIRENVFGLGSHRDHLLASLAHMLYCIIAEEQYKLVYFFVKRIECARATPNANLPYGIDRGMPKGRYSISSSSSGHHLGSSSHYDEDDKNDEDEGTSHASTPSSSTYLNSLQLLNYQRYGIPTSS